MLNKTLLAGLVALGLIVTTGCASKETAKPEERKVQQVISLGDFDPIVIRVNGHGTYGKTDRQASTSQRTLLAMRASKMDAYRNLNERVYGTRIQGTTTVQNLATRDDNIRGYVDNIVRGAKVVSTRDIGNNTYETQMELVLEPRIQRCLMNSNKDEKECSTYNLNSVYETQSTIHGEHPSQRLPGYSEQQHQRGQVRQQQPRARYHLD